MGWLRVGDTFANDPRTMRLASLDDRRQRREVVGFLIECSSTSGLLDLDGVITREIAERYGDERTDLLLALATKAGILTPSGRGSSRTWTLIGDPKYLHLRLADERAWEHRQKADTNNPRLRIPVLLRDGDACRYCGRTVQPNANRSKDGRGRTFDHVRPGEGATSPDDLVVCCLRCNGARGRDWQNVAARDTFPGRWALLPVPEEKWWAPSTVKTLAEEGHLVVPYRRPQTTSDPVPAEHEGSKTEQAPPTTRDLPGTTSTTEHDEARTTGASVHDAGGTPTTCEPASSDGPPPTTCEAASTTVQSGDTPTICDPETPQGAAPAPPSCTEDASNDGDASSSACSSRASPLVTDPPIVRSGSTAPGRVGTGRVAAVGPLDLPPRSPPDSTRRPRGRRRTRPEDRPPPGPGATQ